MIPFPTIRTKSQEPLLSRLLRAIARPRRTGYVSPTCMTVIAVGYAWRGFDVHWSVPKQFDCHDGIELSPSQVAYSVFPARESDRLQTHSVELDGSVLPRRAHLLECHVRAFLSGF